mgnify:FL=1
MNPLTCVQVSCGHESQMSTVSYFNDETRSVDIICEECYQKKSGAIHQAILETYSLDPSLSCGLCTRTPSRLHRDLELPLCDRCRKQNEILEAQSTASYVPSRNVCPDLVDEDHCIYAGPKDSAADCTVLESLNIKTIIVCCSRLPLFCKDCPLESAEGGSRHNTDSSLHGLQSVRTHRLAIRDSLDQDIVPFLPLVCKIIEECSARRNYEPAVGNGTIGIGNAGGDHCGTLIHCNAGVSRTGAVIAGWLMHHHNWSYSAAIEHAKAKRPGLFPNSSFVSQLSSLSTV